MRLRRYDRLYRHHITCVEAAMKKVKYLTLKKASSLNVRHLAVNHCNWSHRMNLTPESVWLSTTPHIPAHASAFAEEWLAGADSCDRWPANEPEMLEPSTSVELDSHDHSALGSTSASGTWRRSDGTSSALNRGKEDQATTLSRLRVEVYCGETDVFFNQYSSLWKKNLLHMSSLVCKNRPYLVVSTLKNREQRKYTRDWHHERQGEGEMWDMILCCVLYTPRMWYLLYILYWYLLYILHTEASCSIYCVH